MQTTVSRGYLPPPVNVIQAAVTSAEIKVKAESFIVDVCNLNASGRFMTSEELHAEIQNELQQKYPITIANRRDKPFTRSDNNNVYRSFNKAKDSFINDHLELAHRTRHMLETIPDAEVPGDSPLQRAINLIKLLEAQIPEKHKKNSSVTEDMNNLLDIHNVAKAKNSLNQAKELSEQEKQLVQEISNIKNNNSKQDADTQGQAENNTAGINGGMSEGTNTNPTGVKSKNLIDLAISISDSQMAEIIRVSRKLKAISQLNTSKVTEFVPDPAGQDVRNKQMENFNDINKLKSSQFAQMTSNKALFNYRVVTNQYVVRERGHYKEKKQLLYVLIDCSGSMTDDGLARINTAAGVLVNRLMAVAKGDAKLYWRFFDTQLHDEIFVDDKSKAYDSIGQVLKGENYKGGGTNFDIAITQTVSHIESIFTTMDVVKPEIFMVTDGDCACHVNHKDLKGIKLHTAFVAHSDGHQLKKLSKQSGGVVLQLA